MASKDCPSCGAGPGYPSHLCDRPECPRRVIGAEFEHGLRDLVESWEMAGIDPDQFVTCSRCGLLPPGFAEGEEPVCRCSSLDEEARRHVVEQWSAERYNDTLPVRESFNVVSPWTGVTGDDGFDPATPIEELDLSVRSFNRLKVAGIHTCGDLAVVLDSPLGQRLLMEMTAAGPQTLVESSFRLGLIAGFTRNV